MDDPYIHFQYAKNLATGHGFSFNPDEPSPGATSPLWVIVLAFARAVGAAPEVASLVIGVVFTGLAAVLAFEVGLAAGFGVALAAIAGLATGACGRLAWASLSGMEIALATALSLAVVRVMQSGLAGRRRAAAIGALAGLAATARPEMTLLGPLAFALEGWRIVRAGGPRARYLDLAILAGAFALVLVPYTAFCLATTGRPLPNTYYAKSWIAGLNDPNLAARRASYLPLWFSAMWHDNAPLAVLVIPGIAAWAWRHMKGAGLVLLWPLAFAAYSIALYPRHFSLSRYTMPLVPFLALLAVAALAWGLTRVRSAAVRHVVIAGVAIATLLGAMRSLADYQPLYLAHCDNILKQQVAAGRWVAKSLPPGARIAMNDVGAITYFGGRYCIDVVGLVSSDFITHMRAWVKRQGTAFTEEALPSYLREVKPDYGILFPDWYPNLTAEPWLTPVASFDYPNTTGGGNRLVVYRFTGTPMGPMDRGSR